MRNRAPAGYASISNDRIGGFGSRNCYNATGNHGNRITHQAEQRSHRFVDHTARDRDRSWRVRSGSVSMQSAAVEVRERLLHDRGRRIDATVVWSRVAYPPYSNAWEWMDRLADHGRGTALIFARTEVKGFVDQVWRRADAVMFLHGRLFFHHPDGSRAKGNSGGPSCLVAYGDVDTHRLQNSGLAGSIVSGWASSL
jgi:hypothetical protein